MDKKIIVIGGGASGLTATIAAARTAEENKTDIKITICERMNRVGKKILATGNGRCNYTNRNVSVKHYFGEHPAFTKPALEFLDFDGTINFFLRLGVFPKEETEGRMYPYSEQASSVLDCLRLEAERLKIEFKTDFDVKEVKYKGGGFSVLSYKGESLSCDRVIMACGGCASPDLGSNGSGFKLLEGLGHTVSPLSPALVQLKLKGDFLKALSGIRFKGCAGLSVNNHTVREEKGEILFTDYGVSGIAVLQLSGFLKDTGSGKAYLNIDFMPEYETTEVFRLLNMRAKDLSHLTTENFFTGLLNKRIGNVIAKKSGIEKLSYPVSGLNKNLLWSMAYNIKFFKAEIIGTNGWKNAQTTAGGAATKQFYSATLESKRVSGLYCCGEIFDIYGECGGYNLQWVWSSGYLAGASAAGSLIC
ncbi:MAG: NAD(P)/FAD-dependent oxidoreductase [Clostridiales bacterium]|nr:NAD(P)/FAD-dependent oxidoreductase [Clostridiales bacterium]